MDMEKTRFPILVLVLVGKKGTGTQYNSWRKHLVMVWVLYALFYVLFVLFIFIVSFLYAIFYVFFALFIFFDSFKLKWNGKEEKKMVNEEDRLPRDIQDRRYIK